MKLEAKKISAGYGGNIVLNELDLVVKTGEILTLIGPNGCGKSTLLKTIGRLLKPSHGVVTLNGADVHRFNTSKLARIMAMLPQSHYVVEDLTVEELAGYGRFPHRRQFRLFTTKDRAAVENALNLTQLQNLRKRSINTLSGGERQRAWIAMTLAQEPKLLMLDEPTTFLDVRCQCEVMEIIHKLNCELNLTVIMVLHDLNLAARWSTRMATVGDGRITRIGTPHEIMTSGVLRTTFGVEAEIHYESKGFPYFIPTGISTTPLATK